MSMCDECAMVDMDGVRPLALMNWMAEVPTYITRALMSWMLYLSRHYVIRLTKDLVGNSLELVINLITSSQ